MREQDRQQEPGEEEVDAGSVMGRQSWRDLLFLHWPVEPAALRTHLPPELKLELHSGMAWLSLVAFSVEGARPSLLPRALGLDFLETNLRTYVRTADGQAGVYFFSLEAASRLAVWGARIVFGLPYFHARMAMEKRGSIVQYATERGRGGPRFEVRYQPGPPVGESRRGSLDHFLHERRLMLFERLGMLWSVCIDHAPCRLHEAAILEVHDELASAAGLPGLTSTGDPPLAHYASNLEVVMHRPHLVRAAYAYAQLPCPV